MASHALRREARRPRAVVIVPTYNERDNIEPLVTQLRAVFAQILDWEIQLLIVDDTSPDKTYEVVKKLAQKYPEITLLINKQKAGLGGAYLKGMQYAFTELSADVVFEFDADLSHDATKIPAFLAAIDQGADMVLGSRYISGGKIPADWGLHRKFLSIVGNWVIMALFTNFSIRDWTTGFRALTKQVWQSVHPQLLGERFTGYTFQIGFLYTAVQQGFKIVEVPFQFVDRTYGVSKLGPEYIKNNLLFIIKMRLSQYMDLQVAKFAMVGATGAAIQLLSLMLYRALLPSFSWGIISDYTLAMFLSIETAIVSNFILNNGWTFREQKLAVSQIPLKFLAFNATSGGSLLLQMIIATVGKLSIGLVHLFTVPMVGIAIDTGIVYAVIGIVAGMFWNFFAYTRFIWNAPQVSTKT
jgi:dolichol-phosphate mannosyltransferase